MKQRDFGLELARGTAGVLVLAVHFFLNSGFYQQPMTGWCMLVSVMVRMACMTCVPLYMLLTGYLCVNRGWSAGYYRKLMPVLLTYLLAGLACMVFRIVWMEQQFSWRSFLRSFTDFSAAPYAWYIEMYIGLFLLSPFFNAAWHALDEKGRMALTATLIVLTSVSPVLNSFTALWPDWWENIYPLTYYAVGAWLRERPIRAKRRWLLLGWAGTAALAGLWSWAAYRRIFWMLPTVAAVVLCSCLLAQPIDWAVEGIMKLLPAGKTGRVHRTEES